MKLFPVFFALYQFLLHTKIFRFVKLSCYMHWKKAETESQNIYELKLEARNNEIIPEFFSNCYECIIYSNNI